MPDIIIDASELDELGRNIDKAKRMMIGRLAERGYQLLRREVPMQTGNLKQGVAAPDVDYEALQAVLTVSARSARSGGGQATVYNAKGEAVRNVTLRPQPAYNYAEVVARGNRQPTLRPKTARAFLIPVTTPPSGEGYLSIGGEYYIVRRSRKGKAANPFDVRAAERLQNEAPKIGEAILEKFV